MNMNNWLSSTRMLFAADAGGGSEAAPAAPASGGGDGGSTSAPSSAPSPPSSTPAPASPGPASEAEVLAGSLPTNWENMGSVDDSDYIEVQAEPKAPLEPKPETPPPAPPPAPVQPPEPQTPPPPTAAQPQAEGAPAYSAADPWKIAEGLEANRDAVMAHLATSKFALTPEEVQEVETDAVAAIPKLLSRVFLESQIAMQKFLAQAVPGMVKQFNTVSSANESAEKQFFSTHPALDINNPQHRAAAVRIATVYRQANPNIPLKQLIAEVGPMVMATLQMNGGVRPPAAPNGRSPPPFRPAVGGGGGVSPQPEPQNPWEGMGRHYDE
jgi:hypothetical protein